MVSSILRNVLYFSPKEKKNRSVNTFQMQIKENRTPFLIVLQGNRRDRSSETKKALCKTKALLAEIAGQSFPLKVFH